jgi:polar amino acid transport system permease protein
MSVAKLLAIYSPWIAGTLALLYLTFRPSSFLSARWRTFLAAGLVIELAYLVGVLLADKWYTATVYVIPAVLAALTFAQLVPALVSVFRTRHRATDKAPAGGVLAGSLTLPTGGGLTTPLALPAGGRKLTPTERAGAVRGIQYGTLLGVIVILAFAMDWEIISGQLFTLEGIKAAAPRIFPDFLNTLRYTLGAFAVSISLGLVLALMKLSQAPLYRVLATTYIEFFRGLPALIVVFAVAYGIPMALGVTIHSVALKAAIALGLVSAAYMAESIRAGIQAVPKGQIEAARSLGLTHGQTLLTVVVPQAFRIVLPPVTNEIILLTKDTSLVYVMGLTVQEYELSKLARETLSVPHGGLTALFAISACYLVITLPLGFLVRRMEKGFGRTK